MWKYVNVRSTQGSMRESCHRGIGTSGFIIPLELASRCSSSQQIVLRGMCSRGRADQIIDCSRKTAAPHRTGGTCRSAVWQRNPIPSERITLGVRVARNVKGIVATVWFILSEVPNVYEWRRVAVTNLYGPTGLLGDRHPPTLPRDLDSAPICCGGGLLAFATEGAVVSLTAPRGATTLAACPISSEHERTHAVQQIAIR
jgi:hypothetical protein